MAIFIAVGISFWLAYSRVVVEPDQLTQIRPVLPNRSVRFDEVQTVKYERSKIRLITDSEEASIPMDMKNALEHSHQILSTIPETAEHIGKADVIEDVRRGRKPTFREWLPTAAPVFAVIGVICLIGAAVVMYLNATRIVSVEHYHSREIAYTECLINPGGGVFLETSERRYFVSDDLLRYHDPTRSLQTSAELLCKFDRAKVWVPTESSRAVRGIANPAIQIDPSTGEALVRENIPMGWLLVGIAGAIAIACLGTAVWGYFLREKP